MSERNRMLGLRLNWGPGGRTCPCCGLGKPRNGKGPSRRWIKRRERQQWKREEGVQ